MEAAEPGESQPILCTFSGRLRARNLVSDDGVQFVCCRICRDRLLVISGLHLSKHETDRETYLEAYGLTPNELIAKDFRIIQSSRLVYFPHGKRDWIAAIKEVYKRERNILRSIYDRSICIFISKAFGFSGIGIRLYVRRDSIQNERGYEVQEMKKESSRKYAPCGARIYLLKPIMY